MGDRDRLHGREFVLGIGTAMVGFKNCEPHSARWLKTSFSYLPPVKELTRFASAPTSQLHHEAGAR